MIDINEIASSGAPSLAEAASSTQALGRDEFLQMLIAQLENQDPLNPQDATEFTAQLAQFSSLEQLISIESSIDGLVESQALTQRLGTAGLIGRDVVAAASQLPVSADGPIAQPSFLLSGNTSSTNVIISDANGLPVRTFALGAKGQGEHSVDWDGRDGAGNPVPPGIYRFDVSAFAGEATVETVSFIRGRVTGTVPSGSDPLLLLGDLAVPLSRVEEVSEAVLPTTGGVTP